MDFSPIKYPNKKTFMQESKALIKELLQSIKIKTAENQDLLMTLKDLKEQLKNRDVELQKQRQANSTLANENNSYKLIAQENKFRKEGEVQMLSIELKNKKELLSKIQGKNSQLQMKNRQLELKCQQVSFKNQELEIKIKELQQKFAQKEQRSSELQKTLTHSKGLVAAAQNHINFLKQQLQILRQKVAEQEINHEKELQGLRDLNVNITQKLNLIQKDYSSIIKYNDSISNSYQSPQSRVGLRTNPKKKQKQISRQKPKDSRKRESVNPQMQTELLKIKRSISDQYEKFGETRDKFMKDRVNKTLLNIETLLSLMSEKVQVDSSSYDL